MRRVVVPLGVVCSVSHLVLAPVHGAELPVVAFLTVLTAVACLIHLGRLWRSPSRAGWCWTAALAAVMVAHAPLVDLLRNSSATRGRGARTSGAGPSGFAGGHLLHGPPFAGSPTGSASTFDVVTAVGALGTATGALQVALCLLVVLAGTHDPVWWRRGGRQGRESSAVSTTKR